MGQLDFPQGACTHIPNPGWNLDSSNDVSNTQHSSTTDMLRASSHTRDAAGLFFSFLKRGSYNLGYRGMEASDIGILSGLDTVLQLSFHWVIPFTSPSLWHYSLDSLSLSIWILFKSHMHPSLSTTYALRSPFWFVRLLYVYSERYWYLLLTMIYIQKKNTEFFYIPRLVLSMGDKPLEPCLDISVSLIKISQTGKSVQLYIVWCVEILDVIKFDVVNQLSSWNFTLIFVFQIRFRLEPW